MSVEDETWDKARKDYGRSIKYGEKYYHSCAGQNIYCLGFIFNKDLNEVLLIRKNRGPEVIVGKLNGIGGKCNKNEAPSQSMIRETKEETGLDISDWYPVCDYTINCSVIYIYTYASDEVYSYRQVEDEQIDIYNIDFALKQLNCVFNLNWIIPMCLNKINKTEPGYYSIS